MEWYIEHMHTDFTASAILPAGVGTTRVLWRMSASEQLATFYNLGRTEAVSTSNSASEERVWCQIMTGRARCEWITAAMHMPVAFILSDP
jgi:hypothetical protein